MLTAEENEARQVVLDFGATSQQLIDRLIAIRPTRIEVCDFVRSDGLASFLHAEDEELPELVTRSLPVANSESLDLILLWDLPNYLNLKALRALITGVAERAGKGCRLHMLIAYSRREMPQEPARYVPEPGSDLRQVCTSDTQAPAPRYSPEDLNLACGGFRYERGVLLANGMQEFVYTWPG